MTLQRFQGVVLKIGNQMLVRHYLWLNYPNDPPLMGIQLERLVGPRKGRRRSCECGTCKKCQHRQYVAEHRPKRQNQLRLQAELIEIGFALRDDGLWTIARTES